jgi:hypothetical protein
MMAQPLFRCLTVSDPPGDNPFGVHEIASLLEKPEGFLCPRDGSLPSGNVPPLSAGKATPNLKTCPDRFNLLLVRQPERCLVFECVVRERRETCEVGL